MTTIDTALASAPAAPNMTTPPSEQGAAMFDCDIPPRPLPYPLSDYHHAPGNGPLHATWQDKPHRIVYDLVAAVRYYAAASADPVHRRASLPSSEGAVSNLRARLGEAHDASVDDDHRACRSILMECIRLLDATPPTAQPAEQAGARAAAEDDSGLLETAYRSGINDATARLAAQAGEDAARWKKLAEWMLGALPMARVQVMRQGQYRVRSLTELVSDIDAARAAQAAQYDKP